MHLFPLRKGTYSRHSRNCERSRIRPQSAYGCLSGYRDHLRFMPKTCPSPVSWFCCTLIIVHMFCFVKRNIFQLLHVVSKPIKSSIIILRASLKTRLIKEKTDRCGSCKESFRRRADALQGRLTKQMTCIAVFSQKGFLEMPLIQS